MKRNHIRNLFILLLLSLQLFASTYEWNGSLNKESAKINEAIYLEYTCEFSDKAELYVIDFNPVMQNEEITIKLLSETTKIVDSKKTNSYEFVAFVHKEGVYSFDFDMVMKKTNQDSIENSVLGRDNGEYEEFTKQYLKQKVLTIEIKKTDSKIVGELEIEVKMSSETPKAYEPYHMEILFEGIANFEDIPAFEFEIEDAKVFASKPIENVKLTKEGYSGRWSQKFAFVGAENFEIPAFEFSYFDLNTASIKQHSFQATSIIVKEGYTKEELLDADEEFVINYEYLFYLLSFIAGFLIAKVKFKKKKKLSSKEKEFVEKIESSKSIDEILFTLLLNDSGKYKDIIRQIEAKELKSIKEVKRLLDI